MDIENYWTKHGILRVFAPTVSFKIQVLKMTVVFREQM